MRSLMFVSSLAMLAATPSAGLAEDCEAPCIDYSGSFDTAFWWIGSNDRGFRWDSGDRIPVTVHSIEH